MYTNADTLMNKMLELKSCVDHHNPWIIAITEIIFKTSEYQYRKQNFRYPTTMTSSLKASHPKEESKCTKI